MTSPAPNHSVPNPPAVLTAAQRHDLARQFERAKQLAAKSPPDYRGVHRVLADCCTLDPGNTLFVAALLENLHRARGRTRSQWFWNVWKLRAELSRTIADDRWSAALRSGWELLGESPRSASVLRQLATICERLDHGPTQIILLRGAREFAPKDIAVLRPLALALSAAGQFSEASVIWQQVLKQRAGDEQAHEFLRILQPVKKKVEPIEASLAEQIRALVKVQDWDRAEQVLSAESGAAGANLELRELGEEISLGRAEERTAIARQLTAIRVTPVMQRLVEEMQQEQRRIELGVAYARHERFPSDPALVANLANCLTAVGNYSEALKYLGRLPDSYYKQLLTAANWQRLRQFDRALAAYRLGIESEDFDPQETSSFHQSVLYNGGVLAEAMNQPALALAWLERLVALSSHYKDAQERLDKLRVICNKGGFSAGPEEVPSG